MQGLTTPPMSIVALRGTADTLHSMAMATEETVLKTAEQVPENASWEDVQERINFVVGVHRGLPEPNEGRRCANLI